MALAIISDIKQIHSANSGPRRHGLGPDMVVLHYTAMQTADAACARLCDEAAEVSAHYLISEQGAIIQLVDEDMRAWHAGAGVWGDVTDVNSHSIGIELANTGDVPFPAAQMDALEGLLSGVVNRWNIPAERIIAHSDMAPDRKFDPGPRFDWRRLALGGLSVWTDAGAPTSGGRGTFEAHATRFGYRGAGQALLSAFRLRFLPHKTGELDAYDISVIKRLADQWPYCGDTPKA